MNTGSAVQFVDKQLVEKYPELQLLKDKNGLGLWGNYVVLEEIGKGVYGSVWRAVGCSSQQMFAIKKMHTDQVWQENEIHSTQREISFLQSLKHQNIVQLKDVLTLGFQDVRPVFELLKCDLGEVLKDLKRNGQMMCMEDLRRYSSDRLEGLYACHARSVMHRDLKAQNLLLTHEGSLKIAGFRLAREMVVPNPSHSTDVVTLWYRAPEMFLGAQNYGCEIDCWSAGCVMAEMATNRPLFPGDCEVDTLFKIFRLLGSPSDTHWPGGMALRHWRGRYPKWQDTGLKPLFDRRPELQGEWRPSPAALVLVP
ncbi:Cyclin-dependent kinase 1 (CDK1) (Cell division control protein 2 homolog) (Cell division protein kinase 1) (p34 protein kinase) [Durusdinium trenchii]|uniref:Cyclin-dependent kinase 2 homolog n=1 Tax=Durusdinium trenchii TaxID=1381693 RepID=A0ABP0PG79_9DINO